MRRPDFNDRERHNKGFSPSLESSISSVGHEINLVSQSLLGHLIVENCDTLVTQIRDPWVALVKKADLRVEDLSRLVIRKRFLYDNVQFIYFALHSMQTSSMTFKCVLFKYIHT